MERAYNLDTLHASYSAGDEARETLRESGLAVVGNEIFGSGKDFIIQKILDFPNSRYGFVPSRKTRDPRPGEVLGTDFVHSPIEEAVQEVLARRYVEWQPLRGTEINGTHIDELRGAIIEGVKPIKDVEPLGQAVLREVNPDLRAIYPLPDIEEWLSAIRKREKLPGKSLKDFISGGIDSSTSSEDYLKKRQDLINRLVAAAGQQAQVEDLELASNPGTLFIVNKYGRVGEVANLSYAFLEQGKKMKHTTSELCLAGVSVVRYLAKVRTLAEEVLEAA